MYLSNAALGFDFSFTSVIFSVGQKHVLLCLLIALFNIHTSLIVVT